MLRTWLPRRSPLHSRPSSSSPTPAPSSCATSMRRSRAITASASTTSRCCSSCTAPRTARLRRLDLAERLGITPSGVARQLAPLERRGLVGRESHPGRRPPRDRRPDRGRRPRRRRHAADRRGGRDARARQALERATSSSAPPRCCSARAAVGHTRAMRVALLGTGTMGGPMARHLAALGPRGAGLEPHALQGRRNRGGGRGHSRGRRRGRRCRDHDARRRPERGRGHARGPACDARRRGLGADEHRRRRVGRRRSPRLAAEHGVDIVDAPVMGSRPQAEEGQAPAARRRPGARVRGDRTDARGLLARRPLARRPAGLRLAPQARRQPLDPQQRREPGADARLRRGARSRPAALPRAHLRRAVRHAVRALEGDADAGGRASRSPSRSSWPARTWSSRSPLPPVPASSCRSPRPPASASAAPSTRATATTTARRPTSWPPAAPAVVGWCETRESESGIGNARPAPRGAALAVLS